jgi:hypothetical protein
VTIESCHKKGGVAVIVDLGDLRYTLCQHPLQYRKMTSSSGGQEGDFSVSVSLGNAGAALPQLPRDPREVASFNGGHELTGHFERCVAGRLEVETEQKSEWRPKTEDGGQAVKETPTTPLGAITSSISNYQQRGGQGKGKVAISAPVCVCVRARACVCM